MQNSVLQPTYTHTYFLLDTQNNGVGIHVGGFATDT